MVRVQYETVEDDLDRARKETSTESFDRIAFAHHALRLIDPKLLRVAVGRGAAGVRVESGRQWGGEVGERWALLTIANNSSRRAIASAVLELVREPMRPWALDVLVRICQ